MRAVTMFSRPAVQSSPEREASRLTIHAQTTELRSTPFFLHDPPPSVLLTFTEITMTDSAIFICQPRFLAAWS